MDELEFVPTDKMWGNISPETNKKSETGDIYVEENKTSIPRQFTLKFLNAFPYLVCNGALRWG